MTTTKCIMIILFVVCFITHSQCEGVSKQVDEDQRTINDSIAIYGPPKDYKKFNLPGPEIAIDDEKQSLPNRFLFNQTKGYTLRVRTITEHFSYNSRYEKTELKTMGDRTFVVVNGQFGEHFERKSGGYYIRTVGYTLDENGFQQFLLDLTTATTTKKEVVVDNFGGIVGAPMNKGYISTTLLGTLIGGNSVG